MLTQKFSESTIGKLNTSNNRRGGPRKNDLFTGFTMIELANCVLAGSNFILMLSAAGAFASRYDWKQIAMRKSGIIETYEKENRELAEKNHRLRSTLGRFISEDDENELLPTEEDYRSGTDSYGYENLESIQGSLLYISDRWKACFRVRWLIDLINPGYCLWDGQLKMQ